MERLILPAQCLIALGLRIDACPAQRAPNPPWSPTAKRVGGPGLLGKFELTEEWNADLHLRQLADCECHWITEAPRYRRADASCI